MKCLTVQTPPNRRGGGRLSLLTLVLVMPMVQARADQSVTLAWDPSTDIEVTGAIVYYGNASRNYPYHTNVGNVTRATVDGLQAGLTYYFAVTATNSAGLESDYSNEVSTSIPSDLTNSFPTITPVSEQIIAENTATTAIPFTMGDAETPAANLNVSATSANTALVPNANIVFAGSGADRTLTIRPATNSVGQTLITVVVSDGMKASSTSFLLTVNGPLTLDPIPDLVLLEDAGLQLVSLTNIGFRDPARAEALTVTARSSHTELIPNPTVTYTSPHTSATLAFTPQPDAYGEAILSVEVSEVDSPEACVSRTFRVLVLPVNDSPTLGMIDYLLILANAGEQIIPLTGITSGAPNENQELTLNAWSSNPALIPDPAVHYLSPGTNATLTFTPQLDAYGEAIITVEVFDGEESNARETRTLTVVVFYTSLIPRFGPLSQVTILEDAGEQVVQLVGITNRMFNHNRRLIVTAMSRNPELIPDPAVSYTSPDTTATLTFAPQSNAYGHAVISVKVGAEDDPLLYRRGGFPVTVIPVNDPPTLDPIPDRVIASDAGPFYLPLTGITGGPTNEEQAVSHGVSSDNEAVIPTPALEESVVPGTYLLKFTPGANALGSARIIVGLQDNNGTDDGGRDSVVQTFVVRVATSPFEDWKFENFAQSVVSDPSQEAAVWGDNADPDHDSLPNLVEYALGGDPRASDADVFGLESAIVQEGNDHYLAVTVLQRKNDPTLRYLPEVRSQDSEPWTEWHPQDDRSVTRKDVTPEFETVTYRDATSVAPNRWRQFHLSIVSTHDGMASRQSLGIVGASAIEVSGSADGGPQANLLSIHMVGSVRYAGTVTAIGGDAPMIQDTDTIGLPAEFFGCSGACSVEFEGELGMDIVRYDAASGTFTLAGFLPQGIQPGDAFCVRRNRTLAEIFGTQNEAGLQAGLSPSLADNFFAVNLNGSEVIRCYYRSGSDLKAWFTVAELPADNLTISPGQSLTLIRRSPAASVLYFHGRLRSEGSYLAR